MLKTLDFSSKQSVYVATQSEWREKDHDVTDDVQVIRNGEKLPCSAVYIPSAEDLAYADASVNAQQKGGKKRRKR